MEYVLQPELLAPPPAQPITEEHFNRMKAARAVLIAVFDIEESFDLLVGNYLEMEGAGLQQALSRAVRSVHDYDDTFELRAELSRRIVNLLSSARMFIDTLPSNAARCGADKANVETWLSAEYGSHFAYRFMEALRNQAQHRGFTVHQFGGTSPWLPPGERHYRETTLRILALRKYLAETGGFKAKTLAECPEQVDILASARRYLESLSKVQAEVREAVAARVDEARRVTREAIDGYVAFISGGSALGLAAIAIQGDQQVEAVPIFLDWDEVRLKLQRRNARMHHLTVHKVSNWPGTIEAPEGKRAQS
jgi:hypothetical protein